jgi:hypothetical protein
LVIDLVIRSLQESKVKRKGSKTHTLRGQLWNLELLKSVLRGVAKEYRHC